MQQLGAQFLARLSYVFLFFVIGLGVIIRGIKFLGIVSNSSQQTSEESLRPSSNCTRFANLGIHSLAECVSMFYLGRLSSDSSARCAG